MRLLTVFTLTLISANLFGQRNLEYPKALKADSINVYFDVKIQDNYQWMENPESEELSIWIDQQKGLQNKVANKQNRYNQLYAQVASSYNDIKRKKLDNEKPLFNGQVRKYIFETKYPTFNNYDNSPNLVYKLSKSNIFKTLIKARDFKIDKNDHLSYSTHVNEQEDLVLVSISHNGSDWKEGYIFDLTTGDIVGDTIKNLRTGTQVSWNKRILYFDSFDSPIKGRELLDTAIGQKLFKYDLENNTNPIAVYYNPDKSGATLFDFSVVKDKLILNHYVINNDKVIKALSWANINAPFLALNTFLSLPYEDGLDLNVELLRGDTVFLSSNISAPNGRVLLGNLKEPNKLVEFIPQYDMVLQRMDLLGKDMLVNMYLHQGQNIALIYNMDGRLLKRIDFPKGKRVSGFYEHYEQAVYTNFSIHSFYHPSLRYQLNLKNLAFQPIQSVSVPYEPFDFETRYVTFKSKDSTDVQMYITCKKDLVLNGENPLLMYAYGGYGTTVQPFFDESNALFLAHEGVLATPNVRGGGAKGGKWAEAGRRLHKQNAIDDFISAADYLIAKKYTIPQKLAISGTSHGGLLVTSAMIQRPDLFQLVIASAGPYDMLRFNLYTVGTAELNIQEFGTPENEGDFINLKNYSPLHNIDADVLYPNLLLVTGDSDDRVPPFHSYKLLAAMQELANPDNKYLLYLTPGAGHGGALTSQDWVDLELFKYYLLFQELEVKFY